MSPGVLRELNQLKAANEALRGQIEALVERVAVLEEKAEKRQPGRPRKETNA